MCLFILICFLCLIICFVLLAFIGDLMQSLDVYISVKAKTKQFAQVIFLMT